MSVSSFAEHPGRNTSMFYPDMNTCCRYRYRCCSHKVDEEGDCCDEKGHGVLTSEVEAWKLSYITKEVLGFSKAMNAQEARARLHSKRGTDGERGKATAAVPGRYYTLLTKCRRLAIRWLYITVGFLRYLEKMVRDRKPSRE